MILTDTGPLLALLDKDDAHHARCFAAAEALPATPLLTTWPCFTEAMCLLGGVGGYPYQAALWNMRQSGKLVLHEPKSAEIDRMAVVMAQYQNVPMDLADASLLAAAEVLRMRQIFTVDSDFFIYRLADGSALEVIPAP
jgi:predicted nucleic acid-binding protein